MESSNKLKECFLGRVCQRVLGAGILHSSEITGTGVDCSSGLSSLSSAFILFSCLHSRYLLSICNTKSLLNNLFSCCGTDRPYSRASAATTTQSVLSSPNHCMSMWPRAGQSWRLFPLFSDWSKMWVCFQYGQHRSSMWFHSRIRGDRAPLFLVDHELWDSFSSASWRKSCLWQETLMSARIEEGRQTEPRDGESGNLDHMVLCLASTCAWISQLLKPIHYSYCINFVTENNLVITPHVIKTWGIWICFWLTSFSSEWSCYT